MRLIDLNHIDSRLQVLILLHVIGIRALKIRRLLALDDPCTGLGRRVVLDYVSLQLVVACDTGKATLRGVALVLALAISAFHLSL